MATDEIPKNKPEIRILHPKIRLYTNFHENLIKKILTQFLTDFRLIEAKNEDKDEEILKNKPEIRILHPQIRLYTNFQENLRKKN